MGVKYSNDIHRTTKQDICTCTSRSVLWNVRVTIMTVNRVQIINLCMFYLYMYIHTLVIMLEAVEYTNLMDVGQVVCVPC